MIQVAGQQIMRFFSFFKRYRRVRTPTILQMEAVECGAAALAIILSYYGRYVPLEELRMECGVSRDGSKASNILKAARRYGLDAHGYRKQISALSTTPLPMIVFWNFHHFLVVEGFGRGKVYLNDPGTGPRVVSEEEFDASFTGVVMAFEPGPDFTKGGQKPSTLKALRARIRGAEATLLLIVCLSLLMVIPGLVIPAFTRVFVDQILVGGFHGWIVPLLVAMGGTALLLAVLTGLQQYYLTRLETKLALGSASRFFWHVLRLPVEFFTQRAPGEISARIALNDRVATLLSGELATTFLNIILISFFALLLFQYDQLLTLIGVAIALLNMVALRYVSRKRVDGNHRLQQERGKLMGTAYTGLQTIETLKATGGESDFFARWAGQQAKVSNAEQSLGVTTQTLSAIPPFLLALNTIAILLIGGWRVMEGDFTIGMLVAFQALMFSFMAPVNQLVQLGSRVQDVQSDMSRLDDVLRYPVDVQAAGAGLGSDEILSSTKLSGQLDLQGISFGYSRLEAPLIMDFDLSLKPGTRVALVGGSGSGKSTVAKLVAGLYRPLAGRILLDGKVREEVPAAILHNSLASVDQEIFLFEGTIRENLTLWDSSIPESHLVQAARDAYIYEEITARPGGFDFRVEEGGRNFSGGQRQRLEIARALVSNPTILVLDEATSALDAITEKIIDDNLRRRGCTCLIVAHRLSTIRDCDEIIVLERGKVVQRGAHDTLYHVDGPYRRLIRAEASESESRLESLWESIFS
ncbi:MAG: NHLP family bacteriocin export ABC transporter peptidase/permease/ATPase subunit [Ardenticatenales bacterium]|nr:NHLP family bacteriocin export ABC transporter peptidase/permease/ATPase subunit [Ardenticatenales bacterium]